MVSRRQRTIAALAVTALASTTATLLVGSNFASQHDEIRRAHRHEQEQAVRQGEQQAELRTLRETIERRTILAAPPIPTTSGRPTLSPLPAPRQTTTTVGPAPTVPELPPTTVPPTGAPPTSAPRTLCSMVGLPVVCATSAKRRAWPVAYHGPY